MAMMVLLSGVKATSPGVRSLPGWRLRATEGGTEMTPMRSVVSTSQRCALSASSFLESGLNCNEAIRPGLDCGIGLPTGGNTTWAGSDGTDNSTVPSAAAVTLTCRNRERQYGMV